MDRLSDAYFAGLLDGEGTIAIYPRRTEGGRLRPVVKINMTCHKTMAAIAEYFGGNTYLKRTPDGRRAQWYWEVTFQKAISVIRRIRPYLITKASAADLVLESYVPNAAGRPKAGVGTKGRG